MLNHKLAVIIIIGIQLFDKMTCQRILVFSTDPVSFHMQIDGFSYQDGFDTKSHVSRFNVISIFFYLEWCWFIF